MQIMNNLMALNTFNRLTWNTIGMSKSLEKLSSGLRINRAADDAAGLAISEKMRSQIKGLEQAQRNAQDGISLIQTAEGALNETHSILQRMRELAVQAANDTYTSSDRVAIQQEINQLKDEVGRIANTTEFNTKKLLDGSASALVSTDKLTTKVFMRDSLRIVDQFGQKKAGGGNYKLDILAEAGTGEVQKSDILKNKHAGDTIQDLSVNEASGLDQISATGLQYGSYQMDTVNRITGVTSTSTAYLSQSYLNKGNTGISTSILGTSDAVLAITSDITANMSILLTVNASTTTAQVSYDVEAVIYTLSGYKTTTSFSTGLLNISNDYTITVGGVALGISASNTISGQMDAMLEVGDKGVITIGADMIYYSAGISATYNRVTIEAGLDSMTTGNTATFAKWNFIDDTFDNATTDLEFYSIYSKLSTSAQTTSYNTALVGSVFESTVSLKFEGFGSASAAATFKFGDGLGQVASLNTKLYDIDKFWDASGNFILQEPKTITIVEGDGKQTSLTLFGSDTIQDVIDKLNAAIGAGLEQDDAVGIKNSDKFVSFVTKNSTATATAGGTILEAVAGTFVIRSAIAGRNGELSFVGDDATINAFSLATIQTSQENKFTIDVAEVHKNTIVATSVKTQGNNLIGVLHPNVDVQFAANTGLKMSWDTANKTFIFSAQTSVETTYVHLADRSLILQIGANPLQDMSAAVGNMGIDALGITNVLVTSNTLANRAIKTLDTAIARVSTERSKLGAIQNRLEHTISNLSTTQENLVAAESRIRDVDMAKEMMTYTKYNILTQAATAMLAQANQAPQAVLQLLR